MLSPVWAHARPLQIVVAVMADIQAGVDCGSENSRRGLVSEIISPLWLGRVRVRVTGRVRVRIGFGVGFGLGL